MKYENTLKEQVLADEKDHVETDGSNVYLSDIATHGCSGGSCDGLIYYKDTHAFYQNFANDIDELLEELSEAMGEPYNITDAMERLNQSDLRNFLAWLSYEVTAKNILQEREEETAK